MTVSQKSLWCCAISALHIQPRTILVQKAVSPVHPHPLCFLGVLYWFKQSLRARLILSHAKSCGYHWKWDMILNSQELAGEAQWQATSASASGQLLRLWLMGRERSGPAWVQNNTTQHVQTSAVSDGTQTRKICQIPRPSNNSDVSRASAECRRPWGGGSEWPRLGWIWCTPTVRICLCVCVANHKLCIQP